MNATQPTLDFDVPLDPAPPSLPAPSLPAPATPSLPAAGDEERLARATLTRLAEPGDSTVGRWLLERPATELLELIRTGSTRRTGPGVGSGARAAAGSGPEPGRLAALRARLPGTDPVADLERVRSQGGRFLTPADAEWPSQLNDLGEATPVGLWVVGTGSLRLLALRSVAVVGARACTAYGAHVAGELAAQLAERGWIVVSGAASLLYPVPCCCRAVLLWRHLAMSLVWVNEVGDESVLTWWSARSGRELEGLLPRRSGGSGPWAQRSGRVAARGCPGAGFGAPSAARSAVPVGPVGGCGSAGEPLVRER